MTFSVTVSVSYIFFLNAQINMQIYLERLLGQEIALSEQIVVMAPDYLAKMADIIKNANNEYVQIFHSKSSNIQVYVVLYHYPFIFKLIHWSI